MPRVTLHHYSLDNRVFAFSTLRQDGYSQGAYASFNINSYCGDNEENVLRNHTLLCNELGIELDKLILPHQTHGTKVKLIDEEFFTLCSEERVNTLANVDALVTHLPRICIGVSTADCIPLLLFDPEQQVIAAIHAGWRGTVESIVKKCISVMTESYGTSPINVRAVIGPGISLNAFEVGDEVYEAFLAKGFSMEKIARILPAKDTTEKWHIDLSEANRLQLLKQGVNEANIHATNICTYAQYEHFFSARRLSVKSGRMFTGIMLT